MKKITALLQVVFCSILLIAFLGTLIAIIPGIISNKAKVQISLKEILTALFGFVFFATVFVIGLKNGIKKLRKRKSVETVEYDQILDLHLSGKIAYKDYRNLIFGLNFKKPGYLLTFGLIVLLMISLSVNEDAVGINLWYYIGIPAIAFILVPVFILVQVKNLYSTNKILYEPLNYKLDNYSVYIKGDTFDATIHWAHFYKIKETKSFFMFYQGEMIATLIEKKMFTEMELTEFKRFLMSLKIEKE